MAGTESPSAGIHSPWGVFLGLGRSGAFLEHLIGVERLELKLLFLDHGDVLAARLALGLVVGAGDVQHDIDDDLGMQSHTRLMQPKRLDGTLEDDLAAVDGEAAGGDGFGDVARRHRAIKLAGVAGRADGDEDFAFQLLGDGLGLFLELEVVGFELRALGLEVGAVVLGRAQRLLLRQQEVARVAILDVDDVAHLAEAADALKQNNLHF